MQDLIGWSRREVFNRLWQHYNNLVPFGPKIMAAFAKRNDAWIEDHVAYRTLPGAHTGGHILEGLFKALGYVRKDDYFFEEKQLKAFWLCPPDVQAHTLDASPKIFISELIPDKFSSEFRGIVARLTQSVGASPLARIEGLSAKAKAGHKDAALALVKECVAFLTTLPPWPRPSFKEYELLKKESEYASWTMLYGHQINHFTVSAHLMNSFANIKNLADFLEDVLGIPMNHVGGVVKGTPELKLEQISTMAVDYDYEFQEGVEKVPYGFVEFAYRHVLPGKKHDGAWQSYYQGFVTSNADKIFESTKLASK